MGRAVSLLVVRRAFWRAIGQGLSTQQAAVVAGVSWTCGQRWFRDSGGMPPICLIEPSGRYLTLAEREEIAVARAAGDGIRAIARRLGRPASTISRELGRNQAQDPNKAGYRAMLAQAKAEQRARRPKPRKLAGHPRLQAQVQVMLEQRMSPEQISSRLPLLFPDDHSMRISHETIYQSLYVHGKGGLRRELTAQLRTGRTIRKPRRRVDARSQRPRIPDMVMIADRPAEIADRALPGDWEGDLITGTANKSAIGTLVDRATRFVLLLHLPNGHSATQVRDAIITKMADLPAQLHRSLTWDQGREMAQHGQISIATDLAVSPRTLMRSSSTTRRSISSA